MQADWRRGARVARSHRARRSARAGARGRLAVVAGRAYLDTLSTAEPQFLVETATRVQPPGCGRGTAHCRLRRFGLLPSAARGGRTAGGRIAREGGAARSAREVARRGARPPIGPWPCDRTVRRMDERTQEGDASGSNGDDSVAAR